MFFFWVARGEIKARRGDKDKLSRCRSRLRSNQRCVGYWFACLCVSVDMWICVYVFCFGARRNRGTVQRQGQTLSPSQQLALESQVCLSLFVCVCVCFVRVCLYMCVYVCHTNSSHTSMCVYICVTHIDICVYVCYTFQATHRARIYIYIGVTLQYVCVTLQ